MGINGKSEKATLMIKISMFFFISAIIVMSVSLYFLYSRVNNGEKYRVVQMKNNEYVIQTQKTCGGWKVYNGGSNDIFQDYRYDSKEEVCTKIRDLNEDKKQKKLGSTVKKVIECKGYKK